MNKHKNQNILILVEERWDAFRGIPKLRRLSLLEYLLGVPWESPSLNSCLPPSAPIETPSIFEQFIHTKLNKTSMRSVGIIKQITTLSTVANSFIFYFCIIATVYNFSMAYITDKIDSSSKRAK